MDIKISTKNELEARAKELEKTFNEVRDELSAYIEATKNEIEKMTKQMDMLSNEYKEIMEELNKRDGRNSKQ